MKLYVVLREDILSLGNMGETVQVKAGYARNYLVPSNLAWILNKDPANKSKIDSFITNLDNFRAQRNQDLMKEQALAELLSSATLVMPVLASSTGVLYQGIGAKEVSHALSGQHNVDISPAKIKIKNGTIKLVGLATAQVSLAKRVVEIKLEVVLKAV